MEPLDIEPEALAFFFFVAIFLSDIAPLDIEPLDIEPLDEPLDIEPELLDCARAEPATATLNTAAAANTESLNILFSRDWPHSRDRCCFTSVKHRSASLGAPYSFAGSYARIPFIAAIFPIAAATAGDASKVVDDLDSLQVLRVLVAKLAFHAQAQRR